MIEVVFRASNPIEEVSAMAIDNMLRDMGLKLITSPAGYVVHVHNLLVGEDLDEPEDYGLASVDYMPMCCEKDPK